MRTYAGGRSDGAGRGVRAAGAAGVSARCRRSVRSHYAGKQLVKLGSKVKVYVLALLDGVSARCRRGVRSHYAGTTQFTCFTGTKARILTQRLSIS
jgi:hypothetical protein